MTEKKKVVMYFPYAASYRAPIYQLIDEEFECEWHFCSNANERYKLRFMDYSKLKHLSFNHKEVYIYGDLKFSTGLGSIIIPKNGALIIPGNIRDLSTWLLMIKGKIQRRKVFVWTHGFYGKENKVEILLKRIYYGLCDKCLVYGNRAKKLMYENHISQPDDIVVIYNSLDYDEEVARRSSIRSGILRTHFSNQNPNIVFVGRLTRVKRLDMVIRAIYELKLKGKNFNAVFIGSGSEQEHLERITADLGLTEQIWFFGACYDEDVIGSVLNDSDLCISPGNVGLTAMHMLNYGVPVITNNNYNTQMPEFEAIQEGKTGAFFEENNLQSLVDTVIQWVESIEEPKTVKNNCYKTIDTYYNPHKQLEILKQII